MPAPPRAVHGLRFGQHAAGRDHSGRSPDPGPVGCCSLLGPGTTEGCWRNASQFLWARIREDGDQILCHCTEDSGQKARSINVFKCITLTKMSGHGHQCISVDI